MGRRKTKGRQKTSGNANRTGETFARPDGRVDAYLTIDTPAGPQRMRTTKATQGIMGHADARTTLKIYTHFEEKRAREAVSRLDGFLGVISGHK